MRHSLLLAKEIQQFGKTRFKDVIQTHAAESAAGILTRVIYEVDGFAGNSEKSDDVTRFIIKIVADGLTLSEEGQQGIRPPLSL